MNEEPQLHALHHETTGPLEKGNADPLARWRSIGVFSVGFAVFFIVLLFKLPEGRVQNLLIAHARILLQEQGLSFSAEKARLSFIAGPAVKLYNVELKALDDGTQTLLIPYLKIRPSLLSLLRRDKQISLSAEMLGGELSGSVGGSAGSFAFKLNLHNLNLGQAPLLKRYTIVDVRAQVDGRARMDFNSQDPSRTTGSISLKVKNIVIPEQAVYGFNLPGIKVGQCAIDVPMEGGRADFRAVECGKDIRAEDLVGQLSGQVVFDKYFGNSKVNSRAVFQLSQNVLKAFPLLEALLAGAKTNDGKYAYRLGGTVANPAPIPGS